MHENYSILISYLILIIYMVYDVNMKAEKNFNFQLKVNIIALGALFLVVGNLLSSMFLIACTLSIFLLLAMITLFTKSQYSKNVDLEVSLNKTSSVIKVKDEISNEELEEILVSIHDWFKMSQCYLNSNYNIDLLEQDLGIKRKNISLAINKIENLNFYQFLAYYRINYAKDILYSRDMFTLESLSVECGFYSKSSFNKYFKKFEGETPSKFKLNV